MLGFQNIKEMESNSKCNMIAKMLKMSCEGPSEDVVYISPAANRTRSSPVCSHIAPNFGHPITHPTPKFPQTRVSQHPLESRTMAARTLRIGTQPTSLSSCWSSTRC